MNDWAGKLNSASTAPREDLRRFAEEMTAATDRKSGLIGQKIEYLPIGIIFTSVGLRVLLGLEEDVLMMVGFVTGNWLYQRIHPVALELLFSCNPGCRNRRIV